MKKKNRNTLLAWTAKRLSESRFRHCRSTAELARDLCIRFGIDPEKGYLAGLCHDLAREMNPEDLRELALQDGQPFMEYEEHLPVLLHARAGAVIAEKELGIDDAEILEAIRNHITGKPGMGILSCILFAADYLEPTRDFLDAKERSAVLQRDLDSILIYVLEKTFYFLGKDRKTIIGNTIKLYQEVRKRREEHHEKR